jgi:hypothetical protein
LWSTTLHFPTFFVSLSIWDDSLCLCFYLFSFRTLSVVFLFAIQSEQNKKHFLLLMFIHSRIWTLSEIFICPWHSLSDGYRGCGKSTILNQVVYWARRSGWFVVYIKGTLSHIFIFTLICLTTRTRTRTRTRANNNNKVSFLKFDDLFDSFFPFSSWTVQHSVLYRKIKTPTK